MADTTARAGIPYPEGADPNDVPADMQSLAVRVGDIVGAPRFTTTERDALSGDDLWDGRVIQVVDSEGALLRAEVFHADDPADPSLGGTWTELGGGAATLGELDDATVGDTAPSEPATNDFWFDTGANVWKRWDGEAWQPSGNATYQPMSTTDDLSDVTQHVGESTAESTTLTVVDITGSGALLGGSVVGYLFSGALSQITIDGGTPIAIEATPWRDGANDQANIAFLPPVRFDTSLKIELGTGTNNGFAWDIWTKLD